MKVYIAHDGTVFTNAADCRAYDNRQSLVDILSKTRSLTELGNRICKPLYEVWDDQGSQLLGPTSVYVYSRQPLSEHHLFLIRREYMNINIHSLDNGATVISTSMHGFKFSDGTECGGNPEIAKALTLKRENVPMGDIKGMKCNQVKMVLNDEQLNLLDALSGMADLVILPFPLLTALRESGNRMAYPNCVSFNATEETQRAAPQDKVVDINNWSF